MHWFYCYVYLPVAFITSELLIQTMSVYSFGYMFLKMVKFRYNNLQGYLNDTMAKK